MSPSGGGVELFEIIARRTCLLQASCRFLRHEKELNIRAGMPLNTCHRRRVIVMKIQSPLLSAANLTLWRGVNEENKSASRQALDDLQQKRLTAMQEALKRLKEMPSARAVALKSATDRVGMLKKRLEALKAMLLHATPEQAKALARELKSIAQELSSIAKELGSGGQVKVSSGSSGETGADAAEPATPSASEGQGEVATAATPAPAASQETGESADAGEGGQHETKADATSANPLSSDKSASEQNGAVQDGDAQALKNALIEAKKLLKEVIAMIKSKLAVEAKDAKDDVRSAEKSLAEIESSLSNDGNVLYSAAGGLSENISADGISEISAASGSNIDIAI